jgi:hypothetical protein
MTGKSLGAHPQIVHPSTNQPKLPLRHHRDFRSLSYDRLFEFLLQESAGLSRSWILRDCTRWLKLGRQATTQFVAY